MLQSIRQKFGKEKSWVYVLLLLVSGILTFTIANSLFPLALYTTPGKLACLGLSFLVSAVLSWLGYTRGLRPYRDEIKRHWLHNLLIALGMTLLLLSVLPVHLPYRPITQQVRVETSTPGFGTRWVDTDQSQDITLGEMSFEGNWQIHNTFYQMHQDSQPASFTFTTTAFARGQRTYSFGFIADTVPADYTILIDGQVILEDTITAQNKPEYTYDLTIYAPEKASSSRVWQLVSQVFPITNALSIFILLLCGVSYMFSQPQPIHLRWLQSVLLAILLYLLWMALAYQNELLEAAVQQFRYPLIALAVMVLMPLLLALWMKQQPAITKYLLVAVLLLAIAVRVYWVRMVPTAQVSDFGRFHSWALQLAAGEPGIAIDRYANFTRLLSLLYQVWPSVTAVEGLNVLLGSATAASLYFLGRSHGYEKAGLIAAYWMALYLPHISMTGIVNTDIPSVFLLVLGALLASLYLRGKKRVYLLLAGAAFALCFFLRGAMLVYLPVLLAPLLLPEQQKLRSLLTNGASLVGAFLLTWFALTSAIQLVRVDEMTIDESRYLIWPLVNGTDVEALGRNNEKDTDLLFSWAPQEVNQRGLQLIKERLLADPLGFYGILDDKFEHLLANATYGAQIAFLDDTHEYHTFQTGWKAPIDEVRTAFAQLSQSAYVVILLLGLVAVLTANRQQFPVWLLGLVVLACVLAAYTFLEVQPRYARPVIPFLLLLGGLVFAGKEKPDSVK